MRARDPRGGSAKKECPPHRWKPLLAEAPGLGNCLYAVRVCEGCRRKEHAVLSATVLASTPKGLWHLADAAWQLV